MLRAWIAALTLLLLIGAMSGGSAQSRTVRSATPSAATRSHVQLAQMAIGADSVEMGVARVRGETVMRHVVPAGSVLVSVSLAPGRYRVDARDGKRTLAEMTVGLSADAHYTVVGIGLVPPPGVSANRPLLDQLRWVFGGAEAVPSYGGMPQLRLIPHHRPPSGKAAVRVVHAAPGVVGLRVALRKEGALQTLDGRLSYPEVSSSETLPPGRHELVFTRPGSPVAVQEWTGTFARGTETTLFLTGGPGSGKALEVVDSVTRP